MKNIKVVLLVVGVFAAACNAKSPETTERPAEEPARQTSAQEGPTEAPAKEETKPSLPQLSGPYHTALDMLANRPNAHRLEFAEKGATVVVDSLQPDFVRYIHGNHPSDWKLNVTLDDKSGALLNKKRTGKVWVPGYAGASEIQAQVWSGSDNNALTFVVNGTKTDPQKLVKGWQVIAVPTDKIGAENAIEFDFSNMARVEGSLAGGAFSWLRVGHGTADAPSNAIPTGQGPLTLSKTEGASYLVWGLKDSVIDFGMTTTPGCGFKAAVEVEDGKGGTTDVLSQEVVALPGDGAQQSFVPLDAIHGQIARVSLRALPNCEVTFDRLRVAVPGVTPEIPDVPAPEHVIFWMIDTLRADHLPIHFETNVRAPNLKRLADEGASFKVAFVQGNESKTSHASLFSGMLPNKHRVVGKGKLRPELELMPEAMKAAGYKTSAFIANGYVSEPWGFVQGWDQFRNHLRDNFRIDGPSMAKAGLDWAKNNSTGKFFLYIGTVDPHVTYREHEEIIGYYDTEPYNGRFKRACYGEDLGKIKGGSIKVDERDKRRIHNLYKNEVEFNDGAFGQLRAGLEELGVWEKTMVIVTADHGDEFWEHGGVGHGHSIYADQTHVPLLIYYPPLIPAKTVVEAGVDVFDIYPTLMDAVKRERPKDLQGKSLLPLIHKVTGDYPEPAIATQYLLHYTMQMQQWKLYLRRGEYQLYDRINDHSEQNDVSSSHPLASRWLLDSMGWMRGHRADWDKAAFGAASNLSPEFLAKLGKSIAD